MIIDSIGRWESYKGILPDYEEAVRFALSLTHKPAGRYDYEQKRTVPVFAMIQEGKLQPFEEGRAEAHRRYADMQIMLEGGETVGYTDITDLKEEVPYDPEKDIAFYKDAGQPIRIRAGMFYLALPQDGHTPCRALKGETGYRKIVLKIPVN